MPAHPALSSGQPPGSLLSDLATEAPSLRGPRPAEGVCVPPHGPHAARLCSELSQHKFSGRNLPSPQEFRGTGLGQGCLLVVTSVCASGRMAEEEGRGARRLVWLTVTGMRPQTGDRVPSRPRCSSRPLCGLLTCPHFPADW